MLIIIPRTKEMMSFVVSAKEFIWLQDWILSGILNIIIYKADDSFSLGQLNEIKVGQEQVSAWDR